ncbi:uncharacterized protein LOC131425920 [Malaya genurostris]|uniref:uncharacterized protein LOC131425920 n=1 Tax=Malaya genurostris TaxID=325434 RepID=UPI0026F3E42A|nr:uncharacterized protein LOC131425920 [Malaya genurostris]
MMVTRWLPGRPAVVKCAKRYSVVVFLLLLVILLLSRSVPNPNRFLEAWQYQLQQDNAYIRYIKLVCRVQYHNREPSTLNEEQLRANIVAIETPKGTLGWCKTFDDAVSFAGLNKWLRPFRSHSRSNQEHPKSDNPMRLLLVEHPFLRLARFYRDCLQSVKITDPFYYLTLEIRNKIIDPNLNQKTSPSFGEFLRFAIDDANQWNSYAHYWQPYMMACEPCPMKYGTVIELAPEKMDSLDKLFQVAAANGGNKSSTMVKVEQVWQQEQDQLRTLYRSVDEYLLDRLVRYYQDDLTLLAYSPDRYYEETYRKFSIEIEQVRPF